MIDTPTLRGWEFFSLQISEGHSMDNNSLDIFVECLPVFTVASDNPEGSILEQLLRYRQELLDWNTRMNLTAITGPEEVLIKHFLDSLSVLTVYDHPRTRLLDIGSGAGFPGLPLKIVRPQWQVVLVEATRKKVAFLQHMIETLQLKNVEAVHARAEDVGHKQEYRAAFDVVTARAVASLPALLEYLVWEQQKLSPKQYPRSGAVMTKKPLGVGR